MAAGYTGGMAIGWFGSSRKSTTEFPFQRKPNSRRARPLLWVKPVRAAPGRSAPPQCGARRARETPDTTQVLFSELKDLPIAIQDFEGAWADTLVCEGDSYSVRPFGLPSTRVTVGSIGPADRVLNELAVFL